MCIRLRGRAQRFTQLRGIKRHAIGRRVLLEPPPLGKRTSVHDVEPELIKKIRHDLFGGSSLAIGRALRSGDPFGRPLLSICAAWMALNALTILDFGR
jgi:hypothetical protein